ncbi:uncharacterized protein CEXT_133521 [Caerostris extrusa]|uniref:Uncharacterized protein n=1 Tax=Caerostris extrusa TaxID=172846 RepID=A0AAV4MES6_CAEEX|nr:uncharacterized protein CEXT_133521 [Caerostris extrusa]
MQVSNNSELKTILLAFLSYNELAFASQVIPRCSGRCLPLSSNLPETGRPQEKAKTREINTWYPIPRKQKELLLFDIRKNSQAATNFNKLHPKGADGYPHANDFPRPLQKEEGLRKNSVFDFGRFWTVERIGVKKWNVWCWNRTTRQVVEQYQTATDIENNRDKLFALETANETDVENNTDKLLALETANETDIGNNSDKLLALKTTNETYIFAKLFLAWEDEIDMKVHDSDEEQLHKIFPPKIKRFLPLRKKRSIDTLKHSDEDRTRVRNKTFEHNKRYEHATDFPEMVKLHHQREGADLKKGDFITLRTSDNVPVVPGSWKSYQTGTPVRDKVTTSPLLPNEVPWKNDSVPRSSYEDRKKSELQIHEEEDSLDKDLEALRMETGIGDQLRNDIKEREPKGGHYIYIRLRDFHGSLKELEEFGNQKENQQKETSFESLKTGDLSTPWAILQLRNSESNSTKEDSVEKFNAKIYSVLVVSKNWTVQRYGKLSHRNHKRLTTQETNIKNIEDIFLWNHNS